MNNFHVVTDLVSGVSNLVAGGFRGRDAVASARPDSMV